MKNSEVLSTINDLVKEEGGKVLTLENMVKDCGLDEMGMIMVQVGLEDQFNIIDTTSTYKQITTFQNYSVRELVHKCRKSLN